MYSPTGVCLGDCIYIYTYVYVCVGALIVLPTAWTPTICADTNCECTYIQMYVYINILIKLSTNYFWVLLVVSCCYCCCYGACFVYMIIILMLEFSGVSKLLDLSANYFQNSRYFNIYT